MRKIQAIYKMYYRYSDVVTSLRARYNPRGAKYQYYTFRNNDGSTVRFPVDNVKFMHYPKTNEGFYVVTLADYGSGNYVLLTHLNGELEKMPLKAFYLKYKKDLYFTTK